MSYNITDFRLKEVNLVLPKGFDIQKFSKDATKYENEARGKIDVATNLKSWNYNENGEGLEMEGIITKESFEVKHLSCRGEFSGNDYEELLKPLFEKFKGDLKASIVWEGGDSITRVTIKKGIVKEREIEI